MVATLIFETAAAIYMVWRYRMSVLARLIVTALVALAVFQLSEYYVCTGIAGHGVAWSRLGYVAISTLPPLGLHILHVLGGKKQRVLVATAYASMAGFIAYFLTYHNAFVGYQCTGNYVIFQIGFWPAIAYGVYYYGWLFTALAIGLHWLKDMKQHSKKVLAQAQAIRGLLIGYLVFLLPTAIANSVSPATRRGIPSIMCGFAVLFACMLAAYIAPRQLRKRS